MQPCPEEERGGSALRHAVTSNPPSATRGVSVVAIISAFNEEDIIREVVGDLITQGVGVYFLDDGSTDRTVSAVEPFVGRGVIAIERRHSDGNAAAPEVFEWARILHRKAELAQQLNADWFIHHDADEFRESPWPRLSLQEAISLVDSQGFNAIDFECLNFAPSAGASVSGDVRSELTTYEPAEVYDRLQIRCWKRTAEVVDLESSGGHEARFPGRRVFPIRFLLRHYSLRDQEQARRKVFHERRPRYLTAERARGWHVQYDHLMPEEPVLADPAQLRTYDPDAVRVDLMLHHRGVEELDLALDELRRERNAFRLERDELGKERDGLQAEIAALRTELMAARQEIQSLMRACDAARARLAVSESDRAVSEQARQLSAMHLQEATRDLEDLRLERTRHLAEIGALGEAAGSAQGRVRALEASLSWRWTAGARAAYRMLRGHR